MKKKRISKNTAYKRGRNFEYRVMNHFRKLGYYVKRSYASKGAEDLIAIKRVEIMTENRNDFCICPDVLLIQCKNLKIERPLSQIEKDNLKALAKQTGGTAIYVYNNKKHELEFEIIPSGSPNEIL